MQSEITKLRLKNGLLVLVKEIHTAPLISHWIWYRVGSKDEVPGITGASHWVEHMQFKGTSKFPSGVLDKTISRYGGVWNAFTYLDWTTYLETLPADKIDLALELEADRMTNSLFEPKEFESERTVIISERQGQENEPLFRLSEQIRATAFRVHAYHHDIIGDMADLHSISREDLYQHYHNHYKPNNAVLTIAGDFETVDMLERIKKVYGSIPAGDVAPRRVRPEPPQRGERRVYVEGPGETTYIQVAYHAPAATHPDFCAMMVLDSLLTGPQSLNMFGGGISNKTSRLYQALIETELAVAVFGGIQATIDPFLYSITSVLHPGSQAEAVITATEVEILSLLDKPASMEELHRAVKQARALFAYGSESITNQSYWLGFAEMFDTYEWFTTYLHRLSQVTPQDVLRVAQTYLRPSMRVLGVYVPTVNGE
jgi:zinc protease